MGISSTTPAMSSITELTAKIADLSAQVTAYLSATSQPEPNFAFSSPTVAETLEYESLRAPLNEAAHDLLRLINGPKRSLRPFFLSHYDLAALQIALDRGFFKHVPLPTHVKEHTSSRNDNGIVGEGISVEELAKKAGMDTDRTARILRLLATHRIFERVDGESESFKHTAASASLARDDDFHAFADMQ
jgi:hypothetical protein